MTPIDRNPDIDISKEDIPRGMTLIRGKNLMRTARSKGIPFGVASEVVDVNYQRKHKTRITVGIIIRDHDVERFEAARVVKSPKTGRAA